MTRLYNEAAADADPAYIFAPQTVEQVKDILAWSGDRNLKVIIHTTGHDFEGRSGNGDVILHMGKLSNVTYDPKTEIVTVGGGARVMDVNRALAPFDRALSMGTNQGVGVAGLTLGGGGAYTSRLHGLTCDALVEIEICTFAGKRFRVTDESDPALMRLLRGAGGGWFGVITELKFRTYPIYPVTMFYAAWDIAQGRKVFGPLEQAMISAPPQLSMRIGADIFPKDRNTVFTVLGQVQGGEDELVDRHFGDLRKSGDWKVKTIPYYEAMASAVHQASGGCFKIKTRFVMKPVGSKSLVELLDYLPTWTPTANPDGAGFAMFAWGGKIREFPAEKSCVPARQAEYLNFYGSSWTRAETDKEVDEQLRWVKRMDDIVAAGGASDLSFVNFSDCDEGKYSDRHLKPFLSELTAMAKKHNPAGLWNPPSRCRQLKPSKAAVEENA
ncbi:MAG TPA: FAD-binding protein [Dongiaceae bacterium]|nr:FAD-binding protein [Dongiaceae bacterium]